MKETQHSKGHRWTNEELKVLSAMWVAGKSVQAIGDALEVSAYAVGKMVVRMRDQGIPLPRRNAGHVAGRRNEPWSQSEVEYVVRRRQERATGEQIALELQRSISGVFGMIQRLRKDGVDVPMLGQGVHKKWDANTLKAALVGGNVVQLETYYARKGA